MELSRYLVVGAMALASFLICGIPFGLIITNRMAGIDVRTVGSGNIGMTNVARSAGGKAALLTFVCDVGKGLVCMLASRPLMAHLTGTATQFMAVGQACDWMCAFVFLACVCGHVFSPYLHFHGGKGISVGLGASLGLWWPIGLGLLAVFLVLCVPTRYISLGSVGAAASLPVQCALWGMTVPGVVCVTVVGVVVVWSHRENIGRLLRGEERAFTIRKEDKR